MGKCYFSQVREFFSQVGEKNGGCKGIKNVPLKGCGKCPFEGGELIHIVWLHRHWARVTTSLSFGRMEDKLMEDGMIVINSWTRQACNRKILPIFAPC